MNSTDKVRVRNVTLEMTLKPFYDPGEAAVRETCRVLFRQWRRMTDHAEGVSVMLWAADGSEILDYDGNPETAFEWAYRVGRADLPVKPTPHLPEDPEGIGLDHRSYSYRENPPRFTYGWLRRFTGILKEVGREETGRPIRVGATFDPGPEFAVSHFKYERHSENCMSSSMNKFMCCYGPLNSDDRPYAGFPRGIPSGTSLGTFLGRQSQHFLTDLGFDYIWFSNGFGFGMETWSYIGPLFKGCRFAAERAAEVRDKILAFWKDFRGECPAFPIETRGTNLSTGLDLGSDAVPAREIYAGGFNMKAPPNSPWAAINGNFGIELAGWMSHVAELPPGGGFPFRFYTHDPWWINSPWLDRYGSQPHDIYLPLSVGRVNEQGGIETPDSVSILTVDDSFGGMPERVPNEVIPHILLGLADGPDAPGPLLWAYPFGEYHDRAFDGSGRMAEGYGLDWLVSLAINDGLPLNTVGSTRILTALWKTRPGAFRGAVVVTPVPDGGTEWEAALLAYVRGGGKALLYGPLAHASGELREMLGVRLGEPLEGEFDLRAKPLDRLAVQPYTMRLKHGALLSGGGWREIPEDAKRTFAAGRREGVERAAGTVWEGANGGAVAWVRGTVPIDSSEGNLVIQPVEEWFPAETLLRMALAKLGYEFAFDLDAKRQPCGALDWWRLNPVTSVARRENGFVFSGFVPDTTVGLRLRFPQGAPILVGLEARLENGQACFHMPKAWRHECRVFVEQKAGVISCLEFQTRAVGMRRRLLLRGLENARVRFYPETGGEEHLRLLRNPGIPSPWTVGNFLPNQVREDASGRWVEGAGLSGELLISW